MLWQELILLYGVSVVLPVFFWLAFFRYQDRKEPEPLRLMGKLFFLGFVAVLVASLIEGMLDGYLLGEEGEAWRQAMEAPDLFLLGAIFLSYFLAGPIEELAKYLILKWTVSRDVNFNQVVDGVIYAATLAAGFSLMENTFYFFHLYQGEASGHFLGIVLFRGVITTALHVLTTGLIGLALGRYLLGAGGGRKKMYGVILLSSLIHGGYNLAIFFSFGSLWGILLLLFLFFFLLGELKDPASQTIRNNFFGRK